MLREDSLVSFFALVLVLLSAYQPAIGSQPRYSLRRCIPKFDTLKPAKATSFIKGGVSRTESRTSRSKQLHVRTAQTNRAHRVSPPALQSGRAVPAKVPAVLKTEASQDQVKAEAKQPGLGVVGFRFGIDGGNPPHVISIFSSMPAAEAGVQEGDLIDAVDGASTNEWSTDDVRAKIMGKPGTSVVLKLRHGEQSYERTMTRVDLNELPGDTRSLYPDIQ